MADECPYPRRAALEKAMFWEARIWKPRDRSLAGVVSRVAAAAEDWKAQDRSGEEEPG